MDAKPRQAWVCSPLTTGRIAVPPATYAHIIVQSDEAGAFATTQRAVAASTLKIVRFFARA